jgi:proliferating cell nuclear antigen
LTKILRCAKDNDVVTIKASDDADSLTLLFESPSESAFPLFDQPLILLPDSDRVGEYDMKLMDIDQEHLGIPDTQYDATITFSSTEFARICRDLSALGESVKIEVDKQGIRFSSDGEIGNGSVLLKHSAGRGGAPAGNARGEVKPKLKKEAKRDPDDEDGSDVEQDDEEDIKPDVDEEEVKPDVDEDDEDFVGEEEEPEVVEPKKRKAPAKKEANGRAKKVSRPASIVHSR